MLWHAHGQYRFGALAAAFLLGLAFFTFVEYIVHRWLYHIAPSTPKRERLQYVMHGLHHEQPRDKSRLAMPLIMSLSVASLLMVLFRWVGGPIGLPFGAGFLLGYATYLFVHYCVHAFRPPRNFLRVLWKHHHLHHYASDDKAFGVSSPLWDWVFGTMPELPAKRKRPAADTGAQ